MEGVGTSIASAIVFAKGVDHCRGGTASGADDSDGRVILEDDLRRIPVARVPIRRGSGRVVRRGRARAATLEELSRSRVSLPCRISSLTEAPE